MSEMNRVLGAAGNGITITLPLVREMEVEDEIEEKKTEIAAFVSTSPVAPETDESKAKAEDELKAQNALNEQLAALEKELEFLKGEQHAKLTFMPRTVKKQGAFEEWLEDRARATTRKTARANLQEARRVREEIQTKGDDLLPDELRSLQIEARRLETSALNSDSELNADIAAGKYGYSEYHARSSLATVSGIAKLMSLLLSDKQPDMTEDKCLDLLTTHEEYHHLIAEAMAKAGAWGKKTSRRKARATT